MENIAFLMPYISLAAGLGALIICGNLLVTGGVQLARRFNISTLVVGLTVIAFSTSAPELFVSIGAAINGSPDIALGNVIGSNISNIAFILALTAVIIPIPVKDKSIGFDLLIMLAATVLLFVFGLNGTIGRIEGICFLAILIAYTVFSIIKEKKNSGTEEKQESSQTAAMKPLPAVLLIAGSVTGLYFGSQWFVNGAREIAFQWGISERVIGISIVALGTSMPELVSSVIAAFRKEINLSIGNIIGSNIFNILMVLGVTTVIHPVNTGERFIFTFDMIWVFGISIAMLLVMIPLSKGKIHRWEGGILLLLFAGYFFFLFR